MPTYSGAGTIFFLGGKNVDMHSDCQNLGGGGHRHIHPIETKSKLAVSFHIILEMFQKKYRNNRISTRRRRRFLHDYQGLNYQGLNTSYFLMGRVWGTQPSIVRL